MGIWCQNDVVSTSMRRHHVASTLIRRHFHVMCPLGEMYAGTLLYYQCRVLQFSLASRVTNSNPYTCETCKKHVRSSIQRLLQKIKAHDAHIQQQHIYMSCLIFRNSRNNRTIKTVMFLFSHRLHVPRDN